MSKIPVISIVGYSGSGKTTLIEKLLPLLAEKGIKTAVIKHDAHEFDMDKPGKDSWRFSRAGAVVSVISSAGHCAIMENRPLAPEEITARISGVDLILTEGFKQGAYRKIALLRAGSQKPLPEIDDSFIAVAADTPVKTSLPVLDLNSPASIADFIIKETR